jgi:hypothetical protein
MLVAKPPSTITATRAVGLPLGLSLVLACAHASADEPAVTAAEALFREGRALIAKRDYAAACAKLEESLTLDPQPGTLFNLARCYELEGRVASAWKAYGDVADAMAAAHQPDRERVARARVAEIEPRVSYVVVEVVGEPWAPAAATPRVTLDGVELGASELGKRVPADVGEHVLSVAAPGKRTWQERLRVERDAETVQVQVPMLQDDAPASAGAPSVAPAAAGAPVARAVLPREPPSTGSPLPPRDRPGLGPQRTAALTLFGSSLLAAGIGTYFGVQSFHLADEARKNGCSDKGCPPGPALSDASGSHTAADVSTVSFVAFGALAAGGLILWITGSRSVVVTPGVSLRAPLWVQGQF